MANDTSQYYKSPSGTTYTSFDVAQQYEPGLKTAPTAQPPPSFYKYDNSPTVYNAQSNQGYETPDQLFAAGGARDFSNVSTRQVNVALTPSTTTNTNTLSAPPVTNNDIQSLLAQNQKFQQQVLSSMAPSAQETAAGQETLQAKNTLQNFDVSVEGGLGQIANKPIAMPFVTGQQAALQRNSAFTRSSLARSYQASVDNLSMLQQNRKALTEQALQQAKFGQDNIATQLQMDAIKREEQATALSTALELGINKPYFLIGQTVYDTNTGRGFASEQDFQRKTGMTLSDAISKQLIQTVDPAAILAQERADSLRRSTRTSTNRSPNSDFTDTQLAKGASNSGLDIEDFTQLSEDEQNYFINGEVGSRLDQGRLTQEDFDDLIDEVDDMFTDGATADEVIEFLLSLGIPADDRYDLEDYVRNNQPQSRGGLFNSGLWSSSQGDKWYNPLSW